MSTPTSLPATHAAIATTAKAVLSTIQVPTLVPGAEDVVVKVSYASLVALDTYFLDSAFLIEQYPVTLGFNASGTVAAVGEGVKGLKVGDRVTAFTYGPSTRKALQEYTILPYTYVAKVPASLPLEAAATIPDNFVTAYYTLFDQLGLPVPKTLGLADKVEEKPEQAETPILVYGAGATSGQYAVQILHAAGYKNIITTSSERHHSYLKSLGATHTFSYTSPTLTTDILRIAPGKMHYAIDSVSASATIAAINEVLAPGGVVALLLPIKKGDKVTPDSKSELQERFYMELPEDLKVGALGPEGGAKAVGVRTFFYHENDFMRRNLMPKILPSLLESGVIQPNRLRLLDESVHKTLQGRVEVGLDLLRNNKISGEKVVVKIAA